MGCFPDRRVFTAEVCWIRTASSFVAGCRKSSTCEQVLPTSFTSSRKSRRRSRENPRWGIPPWTVDFQSHPRPLPDHVDFAVVGGGFTGLSAAAWLRRLAPEKSVAVLEADSLGAGASGRTGGMALAESAAGDLPGLGDVLGGFAEILRELEIECELSLPGAWELGRPGPRRDSPADSRPASRIDWIDHGRLRAVNEVPGGTINPGKLVSGLARAAHRAGAIIRENARVESVAAAEPGSDNSMTLRIALGTHAENHCRGGRDPKDAWHAGRRHAQLRAQRVLFATNAQALEMSGLAQDAHPKLTLAVATAPLSEEQLCAIGLSDGRPFYTVDFPYLWGRVMPSRGVISGAGLVSVDDWRDLEAVDVATGEAAEMIARIEQRVRGLHPALRGVEFTHRWGGPILFVDGMRPVFHWLSQGSPTAGNSRAVGNLEMTKDSSMMPDLQMPGSRRVMALGAYAGHGVALSVYLGRWAAEAFLGRRELPHWE
jgi:glycine/D-amino acid oxidase-like deaminating enzyme